MDAVCRGLLDCLDLDGSRPLDDIAPVIEGESWAEQWERALSGGDAQRVERLVRTGAGAARWVQVTACREQDPETGAPCIVGVLSAAEARERAEEALRIRETAVAGAMCAIAVADLAGVLIDVNPACARMWGYDDAAEMVGRPVARYWADYEAYERGALTLWVTGSWTGELEAVRKDGSRFIAQASVVMMTDREGGPSRVVASFLDITDQRRRELEFASARSALDTREQRSVAELEALREQLGREIEEHRAVAEALKREKNLFASGPAVVFQWLAAENWPVEYVSQNISQFGYSAQDFMTRKLTYGAIIHPADLQRVAAVVCAHSRPGERCFQQDYRIFRADGLIRWVTEFTVIVRSPEGRITHYDGYILDITNRKEAEEALRRSEERLSLVLDATDHGIWDWNVRNGGIHFSPSYYTMLGYEPYELPESIYTWLDLIHPEDKPAAVEEHVRHLENRTSAYEATFRLKTKTGDWRWITSRGRVVERDSAGVPVRMVGTHIDVTQRRRAEESLRESRRYIQRVADTAPFAIYVFHPVERRNLYANAQMARLLGYSLGELQEMGAGLLDGLCHPDDLPLFKDLIRRSAMARDDEVAEAEFRLKNAGGEWRWFRSRNVVFHRGPDGVAVEILATTQDITLHKRAEERVAASLREKEILLREVHHRVKNNLQLVSSLLSLQAEAARDPHAVAALCESRNRVRAMALVHERLHGARDLSAPNVAEYIREVVEHLRQTYSDRAGNITLDASVNGTSMDLDTAIPCALIINELVSNAIKYAFDGGGKGEIRVSLSSDEHGVVLVVADNGVGLPAGVDYRNPTTLGLQLVNLLVRQLNGALGVERGAGSTFRISFARRPASKGA